MNILFFEYNNFGKKDIIDGFQSCGHNITCVSGTDIYIRKAESIKDYFNTAIEDTSSSYDLVFTFNYSPAVSILCNERGIPYISIIYDCPQVLLYSYTVINPCNYIFIFDSIQYLRLKNEGINTVYYMPLAVNTERLDSMDKLITSDIRAIFSSEVSFIGSMYNEEHNLYDNLSGCSSFTKGYLDAIMDAQLKVYGDYFIENMLRGPVLEDMIKVSGYHPSPDGVETSQYIFANYFIARKLAQTERKQLLSLISAYHDTTLYTHNPTPELPNVRNMGAVDYYDNMPYIFKCCNVNLNITLRSIQSGIPLRAMDIMGSGGFLLTNYQSDFIQHFTPGEDFVYYDSQDNALQLCDYYLSHDKERCQIAANGYGKIKESHTYPKRINEILNIVIS